MHGLSSLARWRDRSALLVNRASAIIYGSAALYVLESLAFLIHPFKFSWAPTQITFPPGGKLAAYCREHPCLYDALGVSSLYTLQAVSFLVICLLLGIASRKAKRSAADPIVNGFCAIIIAGVAVDYLLGNFSFKPIWLIPNGVANSPAGLFRYALFFWIASVAALLISNIISPGEAKNARSR